MDSINLKEIRKIDPDAKIIALTSYDGDQDIYRALEAGVRGYATMGFLTVPLEY